MKLLRYASLAAVLAGTTAHAQTPIKTLPYPQPRKVDTVTTYFGTKVPDPSRWL
jgi:prolyl oligopeptidase